MPGDTILTLAIETSNPSASADVAGAGVAAGRSPRGGAGAGRVLGVEHLAPTGRHDDDLVPAIDRLTRRLALRARDFARIAVSVGPGGYTGLRIAVAAAKMIAEACGADCVAVPSALVVARRFAPAPAPFGVALGSKDRTTFVATFGADGTPVHPGLLVSAADVAGLGVRLLAADRFLPEDVRGAAVAAGIEIRPPVFDAAACFEASLALPGVDPVLLLPFYAREPDAVTQWRNRR